MGWRVARGNGRWLTVLPAPVTAWRDGLIFPALLFVLRRLLCPPVLLHTPGSNFAGGLSLRLPAFRTATSVSRILCVICASLVVISELKAATCSR